MSATLKYAYLIYSLLHKLRKEINILLYVVDFLKLIDQIRNQNQKVTIKPNSRVKL